MISPETVVHPFPSLASLEEAFPNSGYYTCCQADGRGHLHLTGADIQDRSVSDIGTFTKATIRVFWTRNTTTPPGGDCYGFTIHPCDRPGSEVRTTRRLGR